MKPSFLSMALLGLSGFFLASAPVQADAPKLSAQRLDALDQRGYFTPAFKAAVHDLVKAKQDLEQAKADEKKFKAQLPDLQKQSDAATAKVAGLRQELNHYSHPENTDFAALQDKLKDTTATPQEQMALAQAYVWAYPNSSHRAEAQKELQQVQQKIADQQLADKDAAATRAVAQAKLLLRVQAKDLSIAEWRDFLQDMAQADVLKYLGQPSVQRNDYWVYSGAWTTDPSTGQKVGLQVAFNGARVNSVALGLPGQ